MAGRKPKINIEQDIYHETKAHKENREKSTPIYQSQEFIAPKTLTKKEKDVWDYIVGIFRETKNCMVSDADIHLMQMYCRDKVMLDEATKRYQENPTYWVNIENGFDKDGNQKYSLKVNPDYLIIKDKTSSCLKLFDQLGLSPLARARVGVKGANAKEDEDMFKKLMSRSDD